METPLIPENIEAYLQQFPPEVREALMQLRDTIRQVAPEAQETIKYGMPAFVFEGVNLVYFAAFQHHIGLYSVPTAAQDFKRELTGYHVGKGSVRFPLNQPLPLDLIARLVAYRKQEIMDQAPRQKKAANRTKAPAPANAFLALFSALARRALEREGITSAEKLADFTEKEILQLHGIGKASLPGMRQALGQAGLRFRDPDSLSS